MATYRLDCPLAAARLLKSGIPATVEHASGGVASGRGKAGGGGHPDGAGGGGGAGAGGFEGSAAAVADVVQCFITAMDSLKLNLVAMDQACARARLSTVTAPASWGRAFERAHPFPAPASPLAACRCTLSSTIW